MKSLDGLHPKLMRPRVEALLADPDAQAMGVTVVSAFRSVAYQTKLWLAALAKYGTPARARKWVAPPGKSNHGPKVEGFGTAVDFGIRGVQAVKGQWPADLVTRFDAIAKRHGLHSPMEWEDWHFEPIPNWMPRISPIATPTADQEDLLMAAAKDDDDARRALIRDWCWRYWGVPLTVPEQKMLLTVFQREGADACLASITDHAKAKAYRKKTA